MPKKKGKLLTSHRYNHLILAVFRPWGGSVGAGCVRLAHSKSNVILAFFHTFNDKFIMNKTIKNYSCFQGLNLGLLLILVTTCCYLYDSAMILPQLNIYSCSFILLLLTYPVFILNRFKFFIQHRTFKNYFSITFLVMLIALLLTTIYLYFLYNYLDNTLMSEYIDYQYNKCVLSSTCNMSFQLFSDYYENTHFSIFGQFQSYLFSLIPCTLYSVIISLLMKTIK